jgi:hypothetical protein
MGVRETCIRGVEHGTMAGAKIGISIMKLSDTTNLPHARRRPTASRSLQELDQQFHGGEGRLEPGLKMEMAFSLSLELSNLFRAGMRSRGFEEPEIQHLFNSVRR